MRRYGVVAVAVLTLVGGSAASAQSPAPSAPLVGVGTFEVCLSVYGPVVPLTPQTLTEGITNGTFRIMAVGNDCGASASTAPTAPSDGSAVTIEARDLSFTPSTFSLPADQDATIVLHNGGRIAHNLTIDALGLQVVAGPGGTAEVTIPAIPAGTYQFYCSVSGHRQAGMEGTLTVQ